MMWALQYMHEFVFEMSQLLMGTAHKSGTRKL